MTKREVEEFSRPGGVGETLQQKLLARAASRENWVSLLALQHCIHRHLVLPLSLPVGRVVVTSCISWLPFTISSPR